MNKQKNNNSSYHQLSLKERVSIEILLILKFSQREVSRFLKRRVSSISDEIKRNSTKGKYDAFKAHQKSKDRRKRNRKYQPLKIIRNKNLWRYIVDNLRQDWSPEIISGRLKNIENEKGRINKDSIYKFIHSPYGTNLEKYLKNRKRSKNRQSRERRGRLLDRKMIDQRPKIIEERSRFGDWEADFIVSHKSSSVLLVLIERRSRYIILRKLDNRNNDLINLAIAEMLSGFPVLSLTLDNDIAFQRHKELELMIKAPVFFCHFYTSWEKGSVENVNKMIRKYIKKKSDINDYSNEFIKEIENKLNHRPRKILKFQTSFEYFIENVNISQKDDLFIEAQKHKLLIAKNKKTSLMFDV